jgi:6-phosphogluconolactonase
MGKVDLVRFDSPTALAQTAAREWLNSAALPNAHYAAFSGGRIAENFFDAITAEVQQHQLSMARVHFFWADERCVPPEHLDSNYRVMHTRLLQPLKIPDGQVHRLKGELGPVAAAHDASAEFAKAVPSSLDFVFLGMGEDGHIASIFPGDPLEESSTEAYRPVLNAPKPPPERVTLAMHAIVSARNVWVLASGTGKAEALGKSLRTAETPLGRLIEMRPFTRIFADIPPK